MMEEEGEANTSWIIPTDAASLLLLGSSLPRTLCILSKDATNPLVTSSRDPY
jgi:hypothetical protein